MDRNININAKVWRQRGPREKGHFETYVLKGVPQSVSFLEMTDILNEQSIIEDKRSVTYDHDCHEGICGVCLMHINGHPHGPISAITACQLHIRTFKDDDTITVESQRSAGFPIIRDLMVDRSAYDKIIQAGGYASISTGGVSDVNSIPIPRHKADETMDAASYIGCGACAVACENGSAMFFVSAKASQLALLPQGRAEAHKRARAMIAKTDELGFGNCTNIRACETKHPKSVSISHIARLNRQFLAAKLSDQLERMPHPQINQVVLPHLERILPFPAALLQTQRKKQRPQLR